MFCRIYAQFFTLTYIQLTYIDVTQLVQLTATVPDLSNGMRLSIQKYPQSKLYPKTQESRMKTSQKITENINDHVCKMLVDLRPSWKTSDVKVNVRTGITPN